MNEKDLIAGQEYEILDSLGMMIHTRKYLGIGYKYDTYDGKRYYKNDNKYYVFEAPTNKLNMYKYAACRPIFVDLKFNGFKVERYGNDLAHLFVDFKQEYFALGEERAIEPKDFNLKYNKDKMNSGARGSFIEK